MLKSIGVRSLAALDLIKEEENGDRPKNLSSAANLTRRME